MARVFLGLMALLFVAFGLYAIVSVGRLGDLLGFTELTQNAAYELRSNYGGVSVGIGLMALGGALRESLVRPALFTLMAYTGGYAIGRLAALPFDGLPPSTSLIAYGVFEAVVAVMAFALLRRGQA